MKDEYCKSGNAGSNEDCPEHNERVGLNLT